jgi:hypothetical protein
MREVRCARLASIAENHSALPAENIDELNFSAGLVKPASYGFDIKMADVSCDDWLRAVDDSLRLEGAKIRS